MQRFGSEELLWQHKKKYWEEEYQKRTSWNRSVVFFIWYTAYVTLCTHFLSLNLYYYYCTLIKCHLTKHSLMMLSNCLWRTCSSNVRLESTSHSKVSTITISLMLADWFVGVICKTWELLQGLLHDDIFAVIPLNLACNQPLTANWL